MIICPRDWRVGPEKLDRTVFSFWPIFYISRFLVPSGFIKKCSYIWKRSQILKMLPVSQFLFWIFNKCSSFSKKITKLENVLCFKILFRISKMFPFSKQITNSKNVQILEFKKYSRFKIVWNFEKCPFFQIRSQI